MSRFGQEDIVRSHMLQPGDVIVEDDEPVTIVSRDGESLFCMFLLIRDSNGDVHNYFPEPNKIETMCFD